MGVTGLLPQLKDIQEPISLETFRGKTLAIDSYAWLHKGVMSCSWELARGEHTTRYIDYFRRKVRMLQHFGVTPYFVFDGDNFSSKGSTEDGREKNRQLKKERAMDLLAKGDKKNAYKYIIQSVDVTPQMAKSVIEYLEQADIRYVVAPYEADPQMVYLEKLGLVDGIISEDSDLLVFGANVLLTKLNEFGECICIRREKFKKCRLIPIGLLNDEQLRMVACLSGCDYTDGVMGMGVVKATKLVKRMGTMQKCLMSLRLEGKLSVPQGFEIEYEKADLSFQFQRVFDPITNEMTTLNTVPAHLHANIHLGECMGPLLEMDVHRMIAHAKVDPISKEPLLSREASIVSQSSSQPPPIATKTASMPNLGTSDLRRRSLTTPARLVPQHGLRSIDSFFSQKPKSSHTSMGSLRMVTAQSEGQLSPTSKRRKLFNSTESKTPLTSSKFFGKKVAPIAAEDSPLMFKTKTIEPISEQPSVLQDMNSSEFELSDPDDDDGLDVERADDDGVSKSQPLPDLQSHSLCPHYCQIVPSSQEADPANILDSDIRETGEETALSSLEANVTHGERSDIDDSLDADSIIESSTINRRIVGATVVEQASSATPLSVVASVKKGLFERYGFRDDSSPRAQHITKSASTEPRHLSKRSPLEPISNNRFIKPSPSPSVKKTHRPYVANVRTKHGVTRNLTLDSFAYKG